MEIDKVNIRDETTYRLVRLLIDLDVIKSKPKFLYREELKSLCYDPKYHYVIRSIGYYEE